MPKVKSLPDDVEFELAAGETLLEGALKASIPIAHACGGRAKCSTCRFWVLSGLESCPDRNPAEAELSESIGLGEEVRLACQIRPEGDLTIRRLVLDETDLFMTSQLERSATTRTGETREVAVFFSDIAGFTSISESLSPYDVMYLLNRYFAQTGEVIEANEGYLDKFIGDGLMAVFGMDGQEDAPIRAVNAALKTLELVDRMKPFFASMYDIEFDIRIGLHWGEALIGSIGAIGHERLTAVGDAVNVASRVESANKDADTRFLVSENLYEKVKDSVEVADFVRVKLRGTSERITLYEIERLNEAADAEVNQTEIRETVRLGGRNWIRLFEASGLEEGEHRVMAFRDCDVVITRQNGQVIAFNNACPHLRLPLFEPKERSAGDESPIPPASTFTEDSGIRCRWHQSCFDLQSGEIKSWCDNLQEDGTSPGMEYLGDISKNRTALQIFPCRTDKGYIWLSLD